MIGFLMPIYVPKLQDAVAVLRVVSKYTEIWMQIPAPPLTASQEVAGSSEGNGAWRVLST